jgi:hypothetical protein
MNTTAPTASANGSRTAGGTACKRHGDAPERTPRKTFRMLAMRDASTSRRASATAF